jgi:hypothetical protein
MLSLKFPRHLARDRYSVAESGSEPASEIASTIISLRLNTLIFWLAAQLIFINTTASRAQMLAVAKKSIRHRNARVGNRAIRPAMNSRWLSSNAKSARV